MISFSTSTTIASVGLIFERKMYGSGGEALLLALAIISLVASLVVSSVNFGTRAKAMESNYKRIQQISIAAENLKTDSGVDRQVRYDALQHDYDMIIDASENHSDTDYQKMLASISGVSSTRSNLRSAAERTLPYLVLLVPLSLLIPFGMWFSRGL